MTATLHAMPKPNKASAPAMLRDLADDIEANWTGADAEVVVVTNMGGVSIITNNDGLLAHYLLCCAAQKMQESTVNGNE